MVPMSSVDWSAAEGNLILSETKIFEQWFESLLNLNPSNYISLLKRNEKIWKAHHKCHNEWIPTQKTN